MSVIVKSMEMPKCCDVCQFSSWSNLHQTACCRLMGYEVGFDDFSFEYRIKRADFCPLVEVKEPHGDLVDRDELEKQFRRAIETYLPKDPTRHMDVTNSNRCHGWTQGLMTVLEAPTVIEAKRSET